MEGPLVTHANPEFDQVTIDAATLWASSKLGRDGAAVLKASARPPKAYKAISVDPASTIRDALVYVNGSRIGEALPMGRILRRHIPPEQLYVDALYPAPQLTATTGSNWVRSSDNTTAPLLCPQQLILRLWIDDPGESSFPPPRDLFLSQYQLRQKNSTSIVISAVAAFYIPGADSFTVYGSNDNNAGDSANAINVYDLRELPELGDPARVAVIAASTSLGTFTVPSTADGKALQEVHNTNSKRVNTIGVYTQALTFSSLGFRLTVGIRASFK